MKNSLRKYYWQTALLSLFLLFYLFAGPSFAAEEAENWRETYDLAMRWLNFVIFAAVIVKFGGKPIKSFVGQQKEEIATEIQMLEKDKQEMESKVDDTLKMSDDSKVQLENLKERILAEGQRRKNQIIEDAKNQSELMIEDAKRKVEHRITAARASFKLELVEAATLAALEKLPKAVTSEDHELRLNQFMSSIGEL